ncbi:MAG: SufD family Fe-S cluster assembly protein [Thermoplasmata archaeon]
MAGAPAAAAWVDSARVESLASKLGDPKEFSDRRSEALHLFRELPLEPDPLYRQYGYFQGVDLTGIDPTLPGSPTPLARAVPGSVRIVHDASGTRVELDPQLAAEGVRVDPMEKIWKGDASNLERFLGPVEAPTDRLTALSIALLNRGYRLEIPDGYARPVHVQDLTVLSRPHEALSVRRSIRAGKESQLLFTEEVFSTGQPTEGQRFYASALDLELGSGAKAVALGSHTPDRETVGFYHRRGDVGPAARLAWIWLGLGGRSTKARNDTVLSGNGSVVHDLQTFYGDGHQSYDSAIRITHTGLDTHGESVTRGVFTDEARGMSRGLVRIEREARKTISFISEHAMLLSRGARSDTLPILEILCRDVKATHSTSVAPVDPEKVFYLESRGIDRPSAVRMISEGFLSFVLERAPLAGLRDAVQPILQTRWDRGELFWTEDGRRPLPTLQVTGTDAAPDWRFDTKMR